jgi:geranylgeranyl pyrophosphate synthase
MTILSEKNTCAHKASREGLAQIFRPIFADLQLVDQHLGRILGDAREAAVREIVDFLLASPGKRIRPALVLLSARAADATMGGSCASRELAVKTGSAVELIHMASLVHDDLIDAATVRHHRASVNARWGRGVAIAFGDYLCSKALAQVAECEDPRVFAILGSELCAMCEGELWQVAGRTEFDWSERDCLAVIEKKTAALFRGCCHAGAWIGARDRDVCRALQGYGFHLGVAFQILDDCRDLLSDRADLGKTPGQDLLAGVVTLPLLYGMRHCGGNEEESLPRGGVAADTRELARIGDAFRASQAPVRIRRLIRSHIARAERQLQPIAESNFKDSLCRLADHIAVSVSDLLDR